MTEVASCTRASEAKFAECIGQELCHWRHPGLLADVVYYMAMLDQFEIPANLGNEGWNLDSVCNLFRPGGACGSLLEDKSCTEIHYQQEAEFAQNMLEQSYRKCVSTLLVWQRAYNLRAGQNVRQSCNSRMQHNGIPD